jgi:hypothetical protein
MGCSHGLESLGAWRRAQHSQSSAAFRRSLGRCRIPTSSPSRVLVFVWAPAFGAVNPSGSSMIGSSEWETTLWRPKLAGSASESVSCAPPGGRKPDTGRAGITAACGRTPAIGTRRAS